MFKTTKNKQEQQKCKFCSFHRTDNKKLIKFYYELVLKFVLDEKL